MELVSGTKKVTKGMIGGRTTLEVLKWIVSSCKPCNDKHDTQGKLPVLDVVSHGTMVPIWDNQLN